MIKSLYSGVTGLKTHNQRMDVIGNNVANVNTTAYKAGTVTFKDVYYQTKQNASGGTYTRGGINPKQVGYGVQLGTISKVMTQSGLTYSDSVFDCALEGSGFFQVMDEAGNIYYTRLGRFSLDDFGNLVDPNGNVVLGVSGDPTGLPAGSQRINIKVPDIPATRAHAEKDFKVGKDTYQITFKAADSGPGGNISLSIIPSAAPFAEMSGSTLNVYMDLTKDYYGMATGNPTLTTTEEANYGVAPTLSGTTPPTAADLALITDWIQGAFTYDLREAIKLGGVNVDPSILKLDDDGKIIDGIEIGFPSIPTDAQPLSAKNQISLYGMDLNFEMRRAGAAGNKYEINFKNTLPDSSTPPVTATMVGNVVTILLPENGGFQDTDVQDALDALFDYDSSDPAKAENGMTVVFGANSTADTDFKQKMDAVGFRRMTLGGGTNGYFYDAFTTLQTVMLKDGSYLTPQDASTLEIKIDRDGVIYGKHPIHGDLLLGRIDVADFVNPEGLNQAGTSYYTESLASGPAQVRIPSEESETFIISGSLEMSNVDLSQEFSDMIITQRGFQANSRIITVSDTMLEELINLKR